MKCGLVAYASSWSSHALLDVLWATLVLLLLFQNKMDEFGFSNISWYAIAAISCNLVDNIAYPSSLLSWSTHFDYFQLITSTHGLKHQWKPHQFGILVMSSESIAPCELHINMDREKQLLIT